MEAKLFGFNAVVIARVFNPSVIRESWLASEGILAAEELKPGYLFSDQGVNVPTEKFNLLVIPQQLQFAPTHPDTAQDLVNTILVALLKKLPHTPLTAVGINFHWRVELGDETLEGASRSMFAKHASIVEAEFSDKNAMFGFYASKDVAPCRMKLDVKPMLLTEPGSPRRGVIHCTFNFHRELGQSSLDETIEVLGMWKEFDKLARDLTMKIARGEA